MNLMLHNSPIFDEIEKALDAEFEVQRFNALSHVIQSVSKSFGALQVRSRPICGWKFVIAPLPPDDVLLGVSGEGGSPPTMWLRTYKKDIPDYPHHGRIPNRSIEAALSAFTIDGKQSPDPTFAEMLSIRRSCDEHKRKYPQSVLNYFEPKIFEYMARTIDSVICKALRPLSVRLILEMEK